MTFRNALRVLYKRVPLADILAQHGVVVAGYGALLHELCKGDPALRSRLDAQERDAQLMARTTPPSPFSHTSELLNELAAGQEWVLLREQAQRHLDSPDPAIAILAKRMLALSLANFGEAADKGTAIELYRSLAEAESADFSDTGNLAIMLIDGGNCEEAKSVVLEGIQRFPGRADYFSHIGQRIVASKGDKDFREQMKATRAKRSR